MADTPPLTRRDALKLGLAGAAGLALPWATPRRAWAAPRAVHARAVIQIWMWGGPSQLDTFDPKPAAGEAFVGPLKGALNTNVDGIQIGELLPQLAQHADKYSIIRSMTHGVNAHETASYVTQTGRTPDRLVYPSAGAVVGLFKGYDHGYTGVVPPYVVLTTPQGRFSEAGFLGQRYKPFATGGDPNRPRFEVEGLVSPGITDERQRARLDLLGALDTLGKAMASNPRFAEFDRADAKAREMMFGKARTLFDLSTEPDALRDRYGRSTFGQSCLTARRLVEAGVPYITINYKGWDTHKRHFETMQRQLPEMDRALATLLADLHDRGLLDSTVVWWGGEFGRTPVIQWEAPWNGGRGHHGQCFCAVMAGGGFKGGHVIGASDEIADAVAERPVSPRDLLGSVYELLGIDADGPLPNPRGIDCTVLPPAPAGAPSGGRLREIMPS